MAHLLNRILAQAAYGFPKPLLPPRTPLEALRSHSFSERLLGKSSLRRLASSAAAVAGYPFTLLSTSMGGAREIRKRNPSASNREAFRMASLAFFHNIPPVEYAIYEFDRPEVRADAAEYLYWTDIPALLWLNRQRGADNDDVQDKARCAAICVEHGLPHVPTLAEFRDGVQVAGLPVERIAETRLWTKPVNLNASRGAMGWTREGDLYRDDKGTALTREQWVALLSGRHSIVQPRLRNHPEIEGITNGAIAAIRMNTVVDRAGRAELIGAMIGLPYGSYATSSGGIGGAIDATTGEILSVFQPALDLGSGHPDTGAPMVGHRLPYWDEAVSLALKAHGVAFSKFASLGWDVVVVPEGPLLLEANSGWGAMGQQVFFGPLGKSAFGRVVSEELDRLR